MAPRGVFVVGAGLYSGVKTEVKYLFDRRRLHREFVWSCMTFSCTNFFHLYYFSNLVLGFTHVYNCFYPLIISIVYGVSSKQGSGGRAPRRTPKSSIT